MMKAARPYPTTYDQYVKDVTSGVQVACRWVKLAVKRHVDDLKASRKKSFPYVFRPDIAARYIMFAQQLKHTKGKWARHNETIHLEPWQQFIVAMIHGWRRKDTGLRRFSKVFIEVARKNGKTTLAACIANGIFFLDGEEGCEIYCCATKRDQAKLAWDEINNEIQKQPYLRARCHTYKMNSTVKMGNSVIKPVGADSGTEDGLNPYMAIIDEYHAHKTNEMLEVMESGMGAREQPLTFIITTAGANKNYPCYAEERDQAIRVLTGSEKSDSFFPLMYELDEGDDWTDLKNAVKANPNLGISVEPSYIEARIQEALSNPRKQALIRTKNLNQWVDSATTWIRDDVWDALGRNISLDGYAGRECFCAVDLSNSIDLSAVAIAFPPEDLEKESAIFVHYYMPAQIVDEKSRQDHVPYALWRDQGWITTTPGNTVDQDYIEKDVMQLIEKYGLQIQAFGYDPWIASQLVNHLQDAGVPMVKFRQGFASMSPASKNFEKAVLDGRIVHDRNPIMAWNLQCTAIESDPAGNIKPSKKAIAHSSRRIDGVVATIMATGLYLSGDQEQTASDDGEVFVI